MATQYLTLIGPPAIATLLSGWLRDAKLPKWLDTLIAFLIVLIVALIWALFAGKLVGDLPADTVVIAAYVAALIAGPMAALHAFLVVKFPSPIGAFFSDVLHPVKDEEPTPIITVVPRSITLPTTATLVQRNSLLSSDPTWRPTVAAPPTTDAVPVASPATLSMPEQGQASPPPTP